MFDECLFVCDSCKYSKDNYPGDDICKKATITKVAPEGIKTYRLVPAEDALRNFRHDNGGKCPHYSKRLICKICELFRK